MTPVKIEKGCDKNYLTINVWKVEMGPGADPGLMTYCDISKTMKMEKFMQDYCKAKGFLLNKTHFYFRGTKIDKNKNADQFLKDDDEIFVTTVRQGTVREPMGNDLYLDLRDRYWLRSHER